MTEFKDLPKIDLSKFKDFSANIQAVNSSLNNSLALIADQNALKHQRELESHEALLKIAENTRGINELVALVRQGTEINKQTFELLQEIQTIMTAKTKEEAESIVRKVIDKANQANEDIGTIQSIISYGKMLIKASFPEYFG